MNSNASNLRRLSSLILIAILLTGCANAPTEAIARFDDGNYAGSANGLAILAESGDPEALVDLGYIYEYGLGVRKDEVKALGLFVQAEEHGYIRAAVCMGVIYVQGTMVDHDYARAAGLFESAMQKGD